MIFLLFKEKAFLTINKQEGMCIVE